jgi:hypothetical protein
MRISQGFFQINSACLNCNVIDNHSPGEKRNIKLFGVVSAQNMLRLIEVIVE